MRRCVGSMLPIVSLLLLNSPVFSQFLDPQSGRLRRFDESNAIGAGSIDETSFYCYWPSWTVVEPALTAVDLPSGTLLWSKPLPAAAPPTFRVEEGWVQLQTMEIQQGSPNQADAEPSFQILDANTGIGIAIPHDPDRHSVVSRPRVHRNRCLTPQGLVVNCSDGEVIADLGPGDHQALTTDGDLYVMTTIADELKSDGERRILRRFDMVTMQKAAEYAAPVEHPWVLVAAKGDIVVAKNQPRAYQSQLVCVDIGQQKELWRVPFPSAVLISPFVWRDDGKLELTMGAVGPVRPVIVNLENGAISPDLNWRDPRLLLAWHYDSTYYPDFVASNERTIVGRWQFQRICCMDAVTGQLRWCHDNMDHLIARLFIPRTTIGEYFVAESESGFDIVTVATGERRSFVPSNVGLERTSARSRRAANITVSDAEIPEVSSNTESALWQWAPLVGPFIPLAVWVLWSLVRWRSHNPNPSRKIV